MTAVILINFLDSSPLAERGLLLSRHRRAATGEHVEGRLVIPASPTSPVQTITGKILQHFLQTMRRKCTISLGKPSRTSAAWDKHKAVGGSRLSYKKNINCS